MSWGRLVEAALSRPPMSWGRLVEAALSRPLWPCQCTCMVEHAQVYTMMEREHCHDAVSCISVCVFCSCVCIHAVPYSRYFSRDLILWKRSELYYRNSFHGSEPPPYKWIQFSRLKDDRGNRKNIIPAKCPAIHTLVVLVYQQNGMYRQNGMYHVCSNNLRYKIFFLEPGTI